jgi:RHS repeat-associated protein
VDGLGSTRTLTDLNGDPVNRYTYDAFGRTVMQSGVNGNVYLFAGEQRDQYVGLVYLRARYMDTGSGRFASRDTWEGYLRQPVSLHRYVYANADPIDFIDPSGRISLPSLMASVTITGILTTVLFSPSHSLAASATTGPAVIIVPGQSSGATNFQQNAIAIRRSVYGRHATVVKTTLHDDLTMSFSTLDGKNFNLSRARALRTFMTISHAGPLGGPILNHGSDSENQPWKTDLNGDLTSRAKTFWTTVGNSLRSDGKVVLMGCSMGADGEQSYAAAVARHIKRSVYAAVNSCFSGDRESAVSYARSIEQGTPITPFKKF